MKIQKKIASTVFAFIVSILLLGAANSTSAQTDRTPKKRLTNPATVKGYVGGEAHDSYVIRAQKGQTLTVNISWRRKDDNRAEFTVSRSANFYAGGTVNFGVESMNGKRWRGKISRTGNYYIYVVAHTTANYTLKIDVK